MIRGIFITGTNTEVGKTIVTRAITRALVNRGMTVAALKPVESGAVRRGECLEPKDAAALLRASTRRPHASNLCAYTFEHAVSPHLAAEMAGQTILSEKIIAFINNCGNDADVTIVEGAGGFLVPLSPTLLYADVMAQAEFGVIIVAPNILGTINATLLTIEAAHRRNIPVLGVILNRTPTTRLGNADAISHFGEVPVLGLFDDVEDLNDDDQLAEMAERCIDLDNLLGNLGKKN